MKAPDQTRFEWLRFDQFSAVLLYELLRFRQAIFVVEQRCAYPDLDGSDQTALHLMLRIEDALAGYLRLVPREVERAVAIGRVAVGQQFRRHGFARRMMDEALARCRRDWPQWRTVLGAQTYLVPFYESFGFVAVSDPYDDAGVPHIDMAMSASGEANADA